MKETANKNIRVSVRGTGCISALGSNLDECMSNMFASVRNITFPSRFVTDHPVKYPVFQISDKFNSPQVSPKNNDLTLTAQFGLAAAYQALEDAGIDPCDLKTRRVGVCMGTTVGCTLNNDQFYIDYKLGKTPGMDPVKRFLNSNPAASIVKEFNLSGPVQSVVNACASGTDAIGIGISWLKAGLCDLVIAGGTDELCKVTYNGFISLMITDRNPCKPFDQKRNGLNLGEGAAAVILESVPQKASLSSHHKCFTAGYGSACDAYHLTAPKPDGQGLKKALRQAIRQSCLDRSDIGFINAHGTGTKDNDQVEDLVLSEILPGVPFFSTKGYTGHTLGAAGAIEAVFTIQSLINENIPASIGFSKKDDILKSSPVRKARKLSCRAAISESVAFGGNNSALIFSRI
ncbi:MAG: beta-ketoacyl-[acyl-carrier-protein] synthase family protein [Desulfobacterales bacterium]|nr:beta-ketoacyl-[acyl-carrier-protein] synthase family protein [Desulfobacterales bacterium]